MILQKIFPIPHFSLQFPFPNVLYPFLQYISFNLKSLESYLHYLMYIFFGGVSLCII